MLHRRALSGFLKTLFSGTLEGNIQVPVGLAQAPEGAAWDGQPNKTDSTFRPYLVITPMNAGPFTGPIDQRAQDWQLPYSLSAFGIQPEQTELIADAARQILEPLAKTVVELVGERYKIQQAKIDSIGALLRVDAVDPAYWGQTDGFSMWLSKERS